MISGMISRKDPQRSRVYRAEASVPEFFHHHIECLSDVQYEAHKLIQSGWWRARWPHVKCVTIRDSPGTRGWAYRDHKRIELPDPARRLMYLLHEMAHLVTPDGVQDHGPEYCATYAELVQRVMGDEVARKLLLAFSHHRVRVATGVAVL